jgi:hypothetical protein
MATVIKVPMSEAQGHFSQMVEQVCEDPDLIYQITIDNRVVAEIASPAGRRQIMGGEAARALMEVAQRAHERRGPSSRPKRNIAAHHNRYLYEKPRTRLGSDER